MTEQQAQTIEHNDLVLAADGQRAIVFTIRTVGMAAPYFGLLAVQTGDYLGEHSYRLVGLLAPRCTRCGGSLDGGNSSGLYDDVCADCAERLV